MLYINVQHENNFVMKGNHSENKNEINISVYLLLRITFAGTRNIINLSRISIEISSNHTNYIACIISE